MLKILLIRSGSTEFDEQGRIQGTLNVPLSDEGRQRVADVGDELKDQPIKALYTSPCSAAVQTGEIIAAACGGKVKKLSKLKNLDHGLWQGMLIEDVKMKQPKVYRQWQERPETVCPPDGETLESARQRILQTCSSLARKHKEGVIGLVVSEPLASLVCQLLKQDELGDLWKTERNCRWELIPLEPGTLASLR